MICIGLTYLIRTCTSIPLWAVADSFHRIRSGPVFDLSRINTGIPIEWTWNLRRSQLLSKHRFKCKCSTKVSPHERKSKTVLDFEFYAADSRFQVIYSSLCQWNFDSGFQLLVGFRILWVVSRIPGSRIYCSTSKNFPVCGIRTLLHEAKSSPHKKDNTGQPGPTSRTLLMKYPPKVYLSKRKSGCLF